MRLRSNNVISRNNIIMDNIVICGYLNSKPNL